MDIQKVYCVNPRCSHPLNLADQEYCASCGASLSLIQRYRSVKPLAQGGFGKTFLAIDDQLPSHPYCVVKQLFFQEQGEQINQKIVQLFQQVIIHKSQHFWHVLSRKDNFIWCRNILRVLV
jgi:serine/threonine protein kinase